MNFRSQIIDKIAEKLAAGYSTQGRPTLLPNSINPTIEILSTGKLKMAFNTRSISGTGRLDMTTDATNPYQPKPNKLWKLLSYRGYLGTGTWTLDGLVITQLKPNTGTNYYTYLQHLGTPSTTLFWPAKGVADAVPQQYPVIIDNDFCLSVTCDSKTTTGNLYSYLLYEEIDLS